MRKLVRVYLFVTGVGGIALLVWHSLAFPPLSPYVPAPRFNPSVTQLSLALLAFFGVVLLLAATIYREREGGGEGLGKIGLISYGGIALALSGFAVPQLKAALNGALDGSMPRKRVMTVTGCRQFKTGASLRIAEEGTQYVFEHIGMRCKSIPKRASITLQTKPGFFGAEWIESFVMGKPVVHE